MGQTTSAAASPLAFQASWSMNFANDKIEVTAFGDANKIYVGGLPDASGDFSGFYDDASAQTYTAALDSLPRSFYLYPSSLTTTQYFFGRIIADMSINAAVAGAVEVSASWNASTNIAKVG
jgi:hypothetical protein